MEARFIFAFAAIAALFVVAALLTRWIVGPNQWELISRDTVQPVAGSAPLPAGDYIARRRVNGVWQFREATKIEVENNATMWAIR